VRRITLLVVGALALAACSSGTKTAARSSSPSSSSSTASTTTTTLDPEAQSSLDQQGAIAFGTLLAAGLRRQDPTITQQQVDCLGPALVDQLGAHHLLELGDEDPGTWTQADRDAAIAAFRGCGYSDATIQRALG